MGESYAPGILRRRSLRVVRRIERQFDVGGTSVTLEQVLEYDAFGQIDWSSDEIRSWAQGLRAGLPRQIRSDVNKGWGLLGFRSRRPWKMVAAFVYYVSWIVFVVAVLASQSPHIFDARDRLLDVVLGLILAFLTLSPAIFLSDFAYRNRLPFFKHHKAAWSAAGLITVLVISLPAIGIADSLHSQPYRLAVERERLAALEKREAQREAKEGQREQVRVREQSAESTDLAENDASQEYDLGDMTDPVLTRNFIAACDAIGIHPDGIKSVRQLPDWASGERYDFSYKGSSLRVCANADKSISSINLSEVHVYEQGYEPLQVDDYLVDWGTAIELQVRAEKTVKSGLNYPSTADFSWFEGWGVGRSRDIYFIGGTVSAKNAFGIAKDTSFYIEYEKSGDSYLARYCRLDGTNLIGSGSVIAPVARTEVGTGSSDDRIVLIEGTLGSYGESKSIDGDKYIWYFVPPGRYIVTSQTNMTKLYLDKNATITNLEGWSECVRVTTLDFTDSSQSHELVVSENQHIELTLRAKVTLVPAR